MYDNVYKIYVALKSHQICQQSHCQEDGPKYQPQLKKLYRDGILAITIRAKRQNWYGYLLGASVALDENFEEDEDVTAKNEQF